MNLPSNGFLSPTLRFSLRIYTLSQSRSCSTVLKRWDLTDFCEQQFCNLTYFGCSERLHCFCIQYTVYMGESPKHPSQKNDRGIVLSSSLSVIKRNFRGKNGLEGQRMFGCSHTNQKKNPYDHKWVTNSFTTKHIGSTGEQKKLKTLKTLEESEKKHLFTIYLPVQLPCGSLVSVMSSCGPDLTWVPTAVQTTCCPHNSQPAPPPPKNTTWSNSPSLCQHRTNLNIHVQATCNEDE